MLLFYNRAGSSPPPVRRAAASARRRTTYYFDLQSRTFAFVIVIVIVIVSLQYERQVRPLFTRIRATLPRFHRASLISPRLVSSWRVGRSNQRGKEGLRDGDIYIYIYICIYVYHLYIYIYITYHMGAVAIDRHDVDCVACLCVSGPETGERKRVAQRADGKLTLLVNLGGCWHEKQTLLVIHFG